MAPDTDLKAPAPCSSNHDCGDPIASPPIIAGRYGKECIDDQRVGKAHTSERRMIAATGDVTDCGNCSPAEELARAVFSSSMEHGSGPIQ